MLLVGVGGQGTILASNILAELGIKLGYDVKKAEVHGMSQPEGNHGTGPVLCARRGDQQPIVLENQGHAEQIAPTGSIRR